MNTKTSYRQGDVLLIRTTSEYIGSLTSNILALGEVTGHKHEIVNGEVLNHSWNRQTKYVRSNGQTVLKHEEHGHIKIEEGLWEVRIQREYDELNNRYVAD